MTDWGKRRDEASYGRRPIVKPTRTPPALVNTMTRKAQKLFTEALTADPDTFLGSTPRAAMLTWASEGRHEV